MLKRKIIFMALACILAVEIPLSLFYVNNITNIEKKQVKNTDTIYINFVQEELKDTFLEAKQLALYSSSDYRIINYFKNTNYDEGHIKLEAFTAYEVLRRFLSSSKIGSYVNKLIVFNDDDISIQADARISGSIMDVYNIKNNPIWDMERNVFHFSKDITFNNDCISMILDFDNVDNTYLYLELSMDVFNKTQNINAPTLNFSLVEDNNIYLDKIFEYSFINEIFSQIGEVNYFDSKEGIFEKDGIEYEYNFYPVINTNFVLFSTINYEALDESSQKAIYTTILVSLTAIIIAILLIFVLSSLITKRAYLIINHINKIKNKDFSANLDISKGNDEFSQIGQTLNEMGLEIEQLLEQTKKHYEKEKKQEIALLQKQINPHFLYNTLESIYWMSKVQKVPGISKMTRSLSDLLKNLAKGTGEKITLNQELNLLKSYVQIQKIRYVEMFDFICDIPEKYLNYKIMKFTLQPFVENSIYHGIEPKGEFGTIKVYINDDNDFDYEIVVEDDGVGIKSEKLKKLLIEDDAEHNHKGLNSIGLKNVDDRIKLSYGNNYGIRIESKLNVGTKIIIKLLKEI